MVLWFKDYENVFANISLKWYDIFGEFAIPEDIVEFLKKMGYLVELKIETCELISGYMSYRFGIETDDETAMIILLRFSS